MADVSTFKIAKRNCKIVDVGLFVLTLPITVAAAATSSAAAAADGDRIQFVTIPAGLRLFDACLNQSATLGALCTAKLQRDRAGVYTDLTAATTAGGADVERMSPAPLDLAEDDVISVLIAGAAIGAGATLTVDLVVARK